MFSVIPLNQTDGYKVDHRRQYGSGTEIVFSNLTARKSRLEDIQHVVFFGLQYFIKEYLIKQWQENFFNKTKDEVVKAYTRRINNYLGPNTITFEHIGELHDLGYLPITIKALPEGTVVPMRIPPMVIYNNDKRFFWLTNYLETILSCTIWGMCNTATIAHSYKKILNKYADITVGNRLFVPWQGHDFSFRGMSSFETACTSGAAHLLSFTGTDTIPAIDFLEQYYGADSDKELIGGSVAATEHSVMTMNAEYLEDGVDEYKSIKRLITEIYPKGIVSIVCDSFDYWKVVTQTLPSLKNEIMARDGKVVVRPDTGDPVKIVCGDKDSASLPKREGTVKCLWDAFGGTMTPKRYKMLDSHIGVIYGDSITRERCASICQNLADKGFCSDNVVYGIGSYTYQYNTRDTFGWAVKATYGEVNGKPRNIYKSPKTDDGTKKSAKGLLAVFQKSDKLSDGFMLEQEATWGMVHQCELKTVFENGKIYNEQTLLQIRARLNSFGD